MTVGHQEQQLLELVAADPDAPPIALEAVSLRKAYDALASMVEPGPPVVALDIVVPGADTDVPVRVYTPDGPGPFGALIYLHGGGWTIGGLETHDHPCRTLCHEAGVVVVSVDYRLAPEDPFPAALDDSWTVLEWVAAHGAEIGVDPSRLAVGGDSGGGNLAAVLALMARDAGGPHLGLQLLVYPAVDLRPDAVERFPSLTENASGYMLTLDHIEFFYGNYRPDPALADDWRLSPLLAADHGSLPPALVITAEYDPLRDEGRAYAEALEAAGTPVTHTMYEGAIHTMYQLAPFLDAGQRALSQSAAALKDAIGDPAIIDLSTPVKAR